MYENYTSSFAATSPLMLADFPSKLSSKSCILTAAKTVTLSGKALNSNNCEEFVVGYAPVSYFVNYGAVSISNLSVKLLLKNYQPESITVKTVAGTYQYVTYVGTLITAPITKSITSGNSVTLSDYGGSSYLTLGTLTESKAMLSSDCKICLLLSVAVGSGSVSYIYLTNSNSSN